MARWQQMTLSVTNRKLNFEMQPRTILKTQTLTILADIKSIWYLQSMDHKGSSKSQSFVMMETFSLITFTLMDP